MANISDTKATAAIVRNICPPVAFIPKATQDALATVLSVCLAPDAKLDKFDTDLCNQYIYVLSFWKVSRDQSRVCWAQK